MAKITLTDAENEEVRVLLAMILTNSDQWEMLDLTLIASAQKKLGRPSR